MSHQKSKPMKHEHRKSEQVKTCQRLWKALVVASQATKARHPSEGSLHDPSPGQEHKTTFGLWQLNDLQSDPVRTRLLCRFIAGVASINKGQFDRFARGFLDSGGQFAYLGPILFISRGH